MRPILMIAAVVLGIIPPAARADDRFNVELTTTEQSAIAGTTNLKSIRVQSDLGEIEVPFKRIIGLSKVGDKPVTKADGVIVTVPLHEINTTAGSRIRGVIVRKSFTLTCEFGDLEVSWAQVATLDRPGILQDSARNRGSAETLEEAPEPATAPCPGSDE